MTSRLFHFAFATLLISSCTPGEQDKYSSYHHGGQVPHVQQQAEKVVLPIADPRGVNMQMMDQKLQTMVSEADAIELKVAALATRLKQLREDIAGLALIKKVSVVADPYAGSDEIARDNPQQITPMVAVNTPQSEPVVSPEPAPAQKTPVVTKASPNKNAGVIDVRHGVHANKTRIVLDINGSTKNTMNYDSEAGILTLTLPDTLWATVTSRTYNLAQLAGYEAKASGQGTIVAMAVKNTSSVKMENIPASNSNSARLIVDLYK